MTTVIRPTGTRPEFSDYVAARRPALLRIATGLTGDPHSAEDLLQSALTSVYLAWPRIRDPQALDGYVRRAMVNQHTSWWRQAWRRSERTAADVPEPRAHDPRVGARSGVATVVERLVLWDLVQSLPPTQRATLVLRYYEGRSEAETARLLRSSVGAVKSNTSRGLDALRRRYPEAAAAGGARSTMAGPLRRTAPACS